MQKKESVKEIEPILVNTTKEVRKERRKMILWNLLGGALIVGTALAVVLGYDDKQIIHEGSTSSISGEKGSSDALQADFAAPPVAESQTTQSALTPQTTETSAIPAQQEDLAAESVADPQDIESASVHRWTETAALGAQEPDNPKSVTAKPKRIKHKSAGKKRHAQRKHRYVAFFPERQNYHYGFPAVSN